MTEKNYEQSTGSSFDSMITNNKLDSIRTDDIVDENADSDTGSDHLRESKCLSQEDFCMSIRNAENGSAIFHSVNKNLKRGILLIFY